VLNAREQDLPLLTFRDKVSSLEEAKSRNRGPGRGLGERMHDLPATFVPSASMNINSRCATEP
jgi:hypothetical protein